MRAAIAALFVLAAALGAAAVVAVRVMPSGRVSVEGAMLYAQYCASCHGDRLQGAPDWQGDTDDGVLRPPAHDSSGHTWHHPDRVLVDYTLLGGAAWTAAEGVDDFKSGMPGFADKLSRAEVEAILEFIRTSWTGEQRAYQAERTAEDIAAQ